MKKVMGINDLLGLTFSDLASIILLVQSKKSTVYEGFEKSQDGYFVSKDGSMVFEPCLSSNSSIDDLNELLGTVETAFEGNNFTPTYCQLASSHFHKDIHNSTIFLFPDSDLENKFVENLKKRLHGKTPWWRVKTAPIINVNTTTMTRESLTAMIKDIYGSLKTSDTLLKHCLRDEYSNRSDSELEIINAIYKSALKTGELCVINEFNPDRHDSKLRRKINRIVSEVSGKNLIADSLEKVDMLCYNLWKKVLGDVKTSVAYDSRALSVSLNKPLQKSKKHYGTIHRIICNKYSLDPSDANPMRSTVPSITINCKKTGLFIKTPSRFALYSELEDLIRSSDN